MPRRRLVALACIGALAAGCVSGATISWEPERLRLTIPPNAFRVHEVTLHALSRIDALDLVVPSTWRSIVSVVPATLHGVAAGSSRTIRFAFLLPATAEPGHALTGELVPGLSVTLDVVPPTAEGTLESVRRALEYGEEDAYLAQFVPGRQPSARANFRGLTDSARAALAQTLQTAERLSLQGATVEYRIHLLLGGQWVPSSIVLQRGGDGVWRVSRF